MTTEEARKFALQQACSVAVLLPQCDIIEIAAKFEAFLLRNDDILRRPDPTPRKPSMWPPHMGKEPEGWMDNGG